MTGHMFKVGDVVTHEDDLIGTIIKCTTFGEVEGGDDDPDEPWYRINWTTVPSGEQPYVGHESEGVLELLQ